VKVLVTGSSGLVGSCVVAHFDAAGAHVIGVDNNLRASFFGPEGDTRRNQERLVRTCRRFVPYDLDVRDRAGLLELVRSRGPFELVVHCAAQPSHDLASQRPFDDFDINAGGTLNLLEAVHRHAPEAVFVLLSTNKVYGDAPNEIPLVEHEMRFDYANPEDREGVTEAMRIDASTHSIFGAGKVAADVLTQEYARTYGLRTISLRCGCLTGPSHAAVELHGFLAFLVKSQVTGRAYTVFGHRGKQVRDNIHALDVATAIEAILEDPHPGAVYNLGGGRANSISIREAFARVQELSGAPMRWKYVDEPRRGDHICYVSDLTKFRRDYPGWSVSRGLDEILQELVEAWRIREGVQV
jgi:CDP-paratose 2-epimerase